MSRRPRNERGASSVEAVLVFPALVVLFFGIVQGAVVLHAGNIAQAAAQAAFEEARLYGADLDDAVATGFAVAGSSGDALTSVTVEVEASDTVVSVTVSGVAPSFVPGLPVAVERTVTGPVERWVGGA